MDKVSTQAVVLKKAKSWSARTRARKSMHAAAAAAKASSTGSAGSAGSAGPSRGTGGGVEGAPSSHHRRASSAHVPSFLRRRSIMEMEKRVKKKRAAAERKAMRRRLEAFSKKDAGLKEGNALPATHATRVLGCMTMRNPVRRLCVAIVENPRFDNLVLFLIVLNSLTIAMTDFSVHLIDTDPHSDLYGQPLSTKSTLNKVVEDSEIYFLVLFTIEMLLKMVAYGLIMHKGAYLRDSWSWLDFVVVVTGYAGVIPGLPNVSALRTFRVLRPLRSLNAVPGLRRLVNSLLGSLPDMANVLLLLLFIFSIFGILGLQIWSDGSFHRRCRVTPWPVALEPGTEGVVYKGPYPWRYDSSVWRAVPAGTPARLPIFSDGNRTSASGSSSAAIAGAAGIMVGAAPAGPGPTLPLSAADEEALEAAGAGAALAQRLRQFPPSDSWLKAVREHPHLHNCTDHTGATVGGAAGDGSDESGAAGSGGGTTQYDCFWPLDPDDSRLCGGMHQCGPNMTCGSAY